MIVKTIFLCSFPCFASKLFNKHSDSEDYDATNLIKGLIKDAITDEVENETETKAHDENQITEFNDEEMDNDLKKLIPNASEKAKNSIELSDIFRLQPVMACLFDFLIGKEIYALKSTNSPYFKLLEMWIESYDSTIQARRMLENACMSSLYQRRISKIRTGFSSQANYNDHPKTCDQLILDSNNFGFSFAMYVTPKVQRIEIRPKLKEDLKVGDEYTSLSIERTTTRFIVYQNTWQIVTDVVNFQSSTRINQVQCIIDKDDLRMIYNDEENSFEITGMAKLINVKSIEISLNPQNTVESLISHVDIQKL